MEAAFWVVTGCILGRVMGPDGKKVPNTKMRGLKLPTQYLDISKCLEWNLHPTEGT